MNIKKALQEICVKQIPKEINGVRTKFVISEEPSIFPFEDTELHMEITPVDIKRKNIAAHLKYDPLHYRHYKNYDFFSDSPRYKMLEKDIEQLLLLYIRNIIAYFEGDVVQVIKYDLKDIAELIEEREQNDN